MLAAVVPSAGQAYDDTKNNLGVLKNIPFWIFSGSQDTAQPANQIASTVDAMKAAGVNVKYTELPGDHGAMNKEPFTTDLFNWMLQQSKNGSGTSTASSSGNSSNNNKDTNNNDNNNNGNSNESSTTNNNTLPPSSSTTTDSTNNNNNNGNSNTQPVPQSSSSPAKGNQSSNGNNGGNVSPTSTTNTMYTPKISGKKICRKKQ